MNNVTVSTRRLVAAISLLGVVLSLAAVLGPYLGLGANENFLFYRWLSLSRRSCLALGLALIAAPYLALLFYRSLPKLYRPVRILLLRTAGVSQRTRSQLAGARPDFSGIRDAWLTMRRPLQKALVILLIGVGIVAAAELFQRAIEPDPQRYFMFPPHTERTYRIDPNVMHGISAKSNFTVNGLGLRGREPGSEPHRIMILGGSTVECFVQDEPNAWPAHLDAILAPKGYWVGNGGRSGLTTFEHILQMRHLDEIVPRVETVIILVGGNDLAYAYKNAYRKSPPVTEKERYERTFYSITGNDNSFPNTFALGRLYSSVMRYFSLQKRGVMQIGGSDQAYMNWIRETRAERIASRPLVDEIPDLVPFLEIYRKNLETIVDMAAAQGIKLVFVTQPLMYRPDQSAEEEASYGSFGKLEGYTQKGKSAYLSSAALATMIDRYNGVLLDVCARRSLNCIDAAAKLPPTLEYYYDGMHYTDAGTRFMATIVSEELRPGGAK